MIHSAYSSTPEVSTQAQTDRSRPLHKEDGPLVQLHGVNFKLEGQKR